MITLYYNPWEAIDNANQGLFVIKIEQRFYIVEIVSNYVKGFRGIREYVEGRDMVLNVIQRYRRRKGRIRRTYSDRFKFHNFNELTQFLFAICERSKMSETEKMMANFFNAFKGINPPMVSGMGSSYGNILQVGRSSGKTILNLNSLKSILEANSVIGTNPCAEISLQMDK